VPASRSPRARGESEPDTGASIGGAMVGITRLAEIALGEVGISFTQYRILHHLHLGRSMQSDLAFRLAVSKQSVTRIVDTLVEKRCLTRKVDPDDRRRVIHSITAKGERALARADEVLERYLMMILQDLDDDADVDTAKAGLRLFGRAMLQSYERVGPEGIEPGRLIGGAKRGLPAYLTAR
jgi:DNA-binding MarR family transcriptional regulator